MAEPAASSKSKIEEHVVAKPVRRKRGSWLKRFFFLLVIFGIFFWFAPSIVATTSLRNELPKYLLSSFPGSLEFGETSLGWTAPVVVKDFRIKDQEGRLLLEVPQFSTSETLWGLVTYPENFGTFKFIDPIVHVLLDDVDSNVEQILAKVFGRAVSGQNRSRFVVEISNAKIEFDNPRRKRCSHFDPISVRLVWIHGTVDECDIAIGSPPVDRGDEARTDWLAMRYGYPIKGDKENPGPVTDIDTKSKTEIDLQPTSTPENLSPEDSQLRHMTIRASGWDLERFAPLLDRFAPNASLKGELTADVTLATSKTKTGLNWDWNGEVSLKKLLLTGIESLSHDRLTFEQVNVTGRVAATDGRLVMHDFRLITDVGDLTATGDFPLEQGPNKTPLELGRSLLSDEDYHLSGKIDLSKLALMLPQTLRIREGIEITAGNIKGELVGADFGGTRRWTGTTEISGLSALKKGQRIAWDKPLSARVDAHRDQRSIIVDQIQCKSDFLQVSGKGTLDDARFTATGDLSKLLTNLERFVDHGFDQLAGQLTANGEVRRTDEQHIALNSQILLDDLAYVVSKDRAWREKHLELSIQATGQTDATPRLIQIDAGKIRLTSAGDTFNLVVTKPIDLMSTNPVWCEEIIFNGTMATWQNRLSSFVTIDGWKFAGTVNAAMTISADSQHIDVSQLQIGMKDLVVAGPSWLVKDPDVKFVTTGRWDIASGKLSSPKVNLDSQTLNVEIADFDCSLEQGKIPDLTGRASYRADLAQLCSWKNLAIPNPAYYLIGNLSGTATITQNDWVLVGSVDAQVEKFVLAGLGAGINNSPQWVALWKEPQVKLATKASYDGTRDTLILDSTRFNVDGVSVGVQGKFNDCSTNLRVDLTGDLAYDWESLSNRLGSQSGNKIQLTGKDHRPFILNGSLGGSFRPITKTGTEAAPVSFPSNSTQPAFADSQKSYNLKGRFGIGWSTANMYGVVAGSGDLSAHVDQGICRLDPFDVAVNDGKLHASPTIYLDRDPMVLELSQGKLLDHVTISRDLCGNSLKFIVPMLADSTEIEGKISVDVNQASFPLNAVPNGNGDGVLSIHGAKALPGSLALQLAGTINQVRSVLTRRSPGILNSDTVLLDLPEQQIPFKLDQGRIYHEGLSFTLADVSVRTNGSVGMDSTLNILAEIAIRDEWLGNNKILSGLKGQSIQIPISGTTSRPQIDPSFFSKLEQQIGDSAINGIMQDKIGGDVDEVINRGLDKLLKGN